MSLRACSLSVVIPQAAIVRIFVNGVEIRGVNNMPLRVLVFFPLPSLFDTCLCCVVFIYPAAGRAKFSNLTDEERRSLDTLWE